MSQDWQKDIIEFHQGMNQPSTINPHICNDEMRILRRNLILEEINETLEAMQIQDIVKIADGITDSIVVLLGTALAYGIDIRPIWDEVHDSNMAKLVNKTFREDGKLLKLKGWKPPEIKQLIEEQMYQ